MSTRVDPLAPVVEGGQLADHRDDGVGMPEIVGGRRRQPLDLPDDVVAEIADQAAMKRGELIDTGERNSLRSDSRQARMPLSQGTELGRAPAVTSTRPARATKVVAAARRPMKEKRLQRSPPSTDSRRNPGPSPTMARKAPTGVRLSATSSAPKRYDGMVPADREERKVGASLRPGARGEPALARASTRYRSRAKVAEPAVETAPVPGVTRPAALLVDGDEHGVAVAVVRR